MMSGVARHRVRSLFPWRMISWPAAKGIRCVKPARYAASPSWTNLEIASFIVMTLWESMGSRSLLGDELETVPDHALLPVDPAHLRPHGHADLHVLRAHVGHLADDLRALLELDDRDGIGAARLLLLRELRRSAARADQGEGVDPSPPAERDFLQVRRDVAVLAHTLRREVHLAALPAPVPDEAV